jgi:hypothetical protein
MTALKTALSESQLSTAEVVALRPVAREAMEVQAEAERTAAQRAEERREFEERREGERQKRLALIEQRDAALLEAEISCRRMKTYLELVAQMESELGLSPAASERRLADCISGVMRGFGKYIKGPSGGFSISRTWRRSEHAWTGEGPQLVKETAK